MEEQAKLKNTQVEMAPMPAPTAPDPPAPPNPLLEQACRTRQMCRVSSSFLALALVVYTAY